MNGDCFQGLRPFSEYKASGQQLLRSVKKGELSQQDMYWAHAPLSKEERADVVLITNRWVLWWDGQAGFLSDVCYILCVEAD